MNHELSTTQTEDPIDETRTDEQIAFDEKHATEPYVDDASEEYWAEYHELHSDDDIETV